MRARLLATLVLAASSPVSAAEADAERGQELFARGCAACHSLSPDENMTGPSLSGVWHRKAGTLPSFPRFSPALRSADVAWDETTLDAWLTDPRAFIPGNRMLFSGIEDEQTRSNLIGFLKEATSPGSDTAQAMPEAGGTMGMGAEVPNLKEASPEALVTSIIYCGDTYDVTTANGETTQFWERNLRFKTDASDHGPKPGAPAIAGAGMMGDRASVIFAAPEEFGQFIKRECSR
jgi:cytochrome c